MAAIGMPDLDACRLCARRCPQPCARVACPTHPFNIAAGAATDTYAYTSPPATPSTPPPKESTPS